MDTNRKLTDPFADLFRQLPEEELPASFQTNVMQQIQKETIRREQRKTWLEWIFVMVASLTMIGLALAALLYIGTPLQIAFPRLELSRILSEGFLFYLYIGILSLFLLFADYRLRRAFHKDE